jgi:hypothetical protein
MRPVTIVIAGAVVAVEETIELAGCISLAVDVRVERRFRVVARAAALGILLVSQAIAVVVVTITADVAFSVAFPDDTTRCSRVSSPSARGHSSATRGRSVEITAELCISRAREHDDGGRHPGTDVL